MVCVVLIGFDFGVLALVVISEVFRLVLVRWVGVVAFVVVLVGFAWWFGFLGVGVIQISYCLAVWFLVGAFGVFVFGGLLIID